LPEEYESNIPIIQQQNMEVGKKRGDSPELLWRFLQLHAGFDNPQQSGDQSSLPRR
jgi:hypothetical protein